MHLKHLFSVLFLVTAFSVGSTLAMEDEGSGAEDAAFEVQQGDDGDVQRPGAVEVGDDGDGEDIDEGALDEGGLQAQLVNNDAQPIAQSGCPMKRCPLFKTRTRTALSFAVAALIGYGYFKYTKGKKNGKGFTAAA